MPTLLRHAHKYMVEIPKIEWETILNNPEINQTVTEADWITPGFRAARDVLKHFVQHKLDGYVLRRNDPNKDGLSGMSPYLHYGQIAPQRVALEAERSHVLQTIKRHP